MKNGSFELSIKSMIIAAELGLTNWKNVLDEKGKQSKFHVNNVSSLPVNVLSELGIEVLKNSFPEFAEALSTEDDKDPLV
jgi:hypothetical protein